MRLSVDDAATGLVSDVHVDCEPTDLVVDLLTVISEILPVRGIPVVDGRALAPDQPVAWSQLREGSVLHYGTRPNPVSPRATELLVLRVVSGVDAGTEVALQAGRPLIVGRAQSCDLVLDDPAVSRRHIQLDVAAGRVTLTDLRSRNGVLLGGRRLVGVTDVHGDVIQVGGTRLVVEATGKRAARVARGRDGELVVVRPERSRTQRPAPVIVAMPSRERGDDHHQSERRAWLPWLASGLRDPVLLGLHRRYGATYRTRLVAARAAAEAAIDDEDADLRTRWPGPETILRTAALPTDQLWERRPTDDDWLTLRLGTADRPPSVRIIGDPPVGWSLPVLRRAPHGMSMVNQPILGVAGPPDWLGVQLSWLILQLVVLHGPDDLRLAVIAPCAGESQLGWMRWLPHLRYGSGSVRAGWDAPGAERMIEYLGTELRQSPDEAHRGTSGGPALVVLLVGTSDLHQRERLADVLDRGPDREVRFVCAEHDEHLLPQGAQARFVRTGTEATFQTEHARIHLTADHVPSGAAELAARSLAPLHTTERRFGGLAGARRAVALDWTEVAPPPSDPHQRSGGPELDQDADDRTGVST